MKGAGWAVGTCGETLKLYRVETRPLFFLDPSFFLGVADKLFGLNNQRPASLKILYLRLPLGWCVQLLPVVWFKLAS